MSDSESQMAVCRYHITNKNTNWHLITDGAVDGQDVKTSSDPTYKNSTLTINPCVTGSVIDHAVVTTPIPGGVLYVALASGAGGGAHLKWSKTRYEWIIRLTGGGATPPNYVITPRSGQDLYWIDKFGTGPVVIVEPGKDITTPEQYWILAKV